MVAGQTYGPSGRVVKRASARRSRIAMNELNHAMSSGNVLSQRINTFGNTKDQ